MGRRPRLIQGLASVFLALAAAGQEMRYHLWQEEVELALLLRSCSDHLGIPIDYDRSVVKGSIAIEAPEGLTFDQLWNLTNRRLAENDLACIQLPGQESISVVSLEAAPGLARIEYGELYDCHAGFVKALYHIEHADPRELAESIKAILPKQGTVVTTLATQEHLIISGLKPQVSEVITALGFMDSGPETVAVVEIEPRHVSAISLSAQLEQVVQAREAAGAEKLKGQALASAGRGTLLLIAPDSERGQWEEWITQFDQPESVVKRTYTPTRFGLAETARLVEEVVGSKPPGWRLVEDELTGTLLITAPVGSHEAIAGLMSRLEATDLSISRDLRSFAVSHRDVEELLELLRDLMEQGRLPTGSEQGPNAIRAVQASDGLTLTADRETNRILAYGEVHLLGQLEELVRVLDVEHPQVLVEVLVVSLTESQMYDLGVELRYGGETRGTFGQVSSLFGLGAPGITESSLPALSGTGGTGVVLDPGTFSGVIRALEAVNQGRSLSAPKVLVANHQDAQFNSVLQTPYLSTSATNTVATTGLGGTSDAGTTVTVTPHILDADRLRLEYSVSISSFVGESIDPALPPPRQENLLDSTVVVPDGHTVVVGGVEVENQAEGRTSVPVLGQLPILGGLFRSYSTSNTRTRFYVFLRCSVLSRGFEELKYLSAIDRQDASLPDDVPTLKPRVIR